MSLIDISVVVLSYTASSVVCTALTALLWLHNRKHFAGIGFWLAGFLMQWIAIVLIALRDIVPDILSVVAGNTILILGVILLYKGLQQFVDKRGSQIHNAVLLVAFILAHTYFTFIQPSLAARNINASLALLVLFSQAAWLTLYKTHSDLRPSTRGVGIVFVAVAALSVTRIIVDLVAPPENAFFRPDHFDTFLLLAYHIAFITLTFNLSLMVNHRLSTRLEHDSARRQQAEEEPIRLRLRLWEYAATHPVDELMQKALDEIEDLTDSLIGFYHFVEEDQTTLSLQAWSTRTRQEFCHAEGSGLHYSIDQAGVWVDCVHQRKPVIHNNYAALPHRKGMPDGHAEVVRELVVPTMRGKQVVSILGVGNKPSDYDEKDIKLVAYVADIVWEIVERRRAEEAVKKREEDFRKVFEANPVPITITRLADSQVVHANQAALEYFEVQADDLPVTRTHSFYANPANRQRILDEVQARGEVSNMQVEIRSKTGIPKWAVVNILPIDFEGQPCVLSGFADVTERKRAEEALRQSEAHLKMSQEIAHLGSWELDLSNNRLMWSDEVYRIFGLEPQEFGATYEAFLEAIYPDDRKAVDHAYSDSLSKGHDIYEIEHRIVNKSTGETRYVHEKCEHQRDASGKVMRSIGMIHDITERRHVEEALRKSNADLQARSEELNAFGHTVAHDLKNPLSSIIGFAYLMEDRENLPTEEEMVQMVKAVKQLGLKMDSIIEELMLLAGLREADIEMKPLNMETIMTEILWRLTYLIDQAQAEIAYPMTWPKAMGYAPWVEEVWMNYISNAIKYGGHPPHIELGVTAEGEHIRFWVRDNGLGLAPDTQARLFAPFERLGQAHISGHGLGLSIVRRIVERMGGQVGVESTGVAGEGSTFSFTLPAA